jgi:uncharacterized membrane protein
MQWFFLSLGAALCWSVSQVFVKKGFDYIPPLWTNIVNNFLMIIILIPAVLWINRFKVNTPTLPVLTLIFTASCLYLLFFYAISKGQLSLTGTVVAGYPVVTIVLSYLLLHERLAHLQYAGVAFILFGGVLVVLPKIKSVNPIKDFSWILWGLAGAFAIGSGDFLTKLSINHIGSYSHMFFISLTSNAVSALNYMIDKGNRPLPKVIHHSFLPTFLGLIIHIIGVFFFYLAFDYGKVSLIVSVSSIYPALMALLAVRLLKDKINKKQAIGIACTVCGLIIIGIGTGQ